MADTAKDLTEVVLGLMGQDGRAVPTQREVRKACGDTGSFKRIDQALLTAQVARGLIPSGKVTLEKEFAAVLGTLQVPTVVPAFDAIVGLPKEALAKFQEGLMLCAIHTEQQQAAILRGVSEERARHDQQVTSLRRQVDDLTDALDEAERSAREVAQKHAATVTQLLVKTGVLEKECDLERLGRSTAEARAASLESELTALREKAETEIEKRHGAELRVASLEAASEARPAAKPEGENVMRVARPRRRRKAAAA